MNDQATFRFDVGEADPFALTDSYSESQRVAHRATQFARWDEENLPANYGRTLDYEWVEVGEMEGDFDMDTVMDHLIAGVEQEIRGMTDEELARSLHEPPTNSFDIADKEIAARVIAKAGACVTPKDLDFVAAAAREHGVYTLCAREIAESDRRIVDRIKGGVTMMNGRASVAAWTPGFYRRMAEQGYTEVSSCE